MNLIEQLGGYERAKHEFEMIKEMKPIYPGEIETNNHLLLEYRRQHNIFEVGDKVIFIHPFELGDLFTVHSISERFIGVKRNNDECIYYAEIVWGLKHANDAEIKAGKRLEVNDAS